MNFNLQILPLSIHPCESFGDGIRIFSESEKQQTQVLQHHWPKLESNAGRHISFLLVCYLNTFVFTSLCLTNISCSALSFLASLSFQLSHQIRIYCTASSLDRLTQLIALVTSRSTCGSSPFFSQTRSPDFEFQSLYPTCHCLEVHRLFYQTQ